MEEKKLTGYPSIDKPWLKYYSEEAINAKLPECSLYEYLWENNKDYLNNTALNYYDRKITYGQLFEGIEKVAKAFSAMGVREGEIVAICSVNTPETVYALYALNRLGAVANMIDPRTDVAGVRHYLEECNIRFVMTIELAYPLFVKVEQDYKIEKIISVSAADSLPQPKKFLYRLKNKQPVLKENAMTWDAFLATGREAEYIPATYKKDTCCVIAHTGGTTGDPKGVMLSNDNINCLAHNYGYIDIPIIRGDLFFNDLPPFIMYGLCFALHTTLSRGLEVIIYPIFDSKNFPKLYAKYKPQHFCALPDHLYFLSTAKVSSKLDLSTSITIGVGGDSLDCDLEKRVNEYLYSHGCKYQVVKGYGMTELSATAISSCVSANAIGCVGIPLIINTAKIVDPDNLKELSYGEMGEIWISGPSVMLGYYNKPKETSETIIIDDTGMRWIRTGDLGYMTSDGWIYHKGRIRRIYLTSHEGQPAKIFPMLVEEKIKQSDAVSNCVVVARLKENSANYEAVAFVVCKDQKHDGTEQELRDICANTVPSYMQPVEYRFVTEFPHTPVGKVDFRALETIAQQKG